MGGRWQKKMWSWRLDSTNSGEEGSGAGFFFYHGSERLDTLKEINLFTGFWEKVLALEISCVPWKLLIISLHVVQYFVSRTNVSKDEMFVR
jgi:hypothetical protein